MKSFKFEITKLDTHPDEWRHETTIYAEDVLDASSKIRQMYPETIFKIRLNDRV